MIHLPALAVADSGYAIGVVSKTSRCIIAVQHDASVHLFHPTITVANYSGRQPTFAAFRRDSSGPQKKGDERLIVWHLRRCTEPCETDNP